MTKDSGAVVKERVEKAINSNMDISPLLQAMTNKNYVIILGAGVSTSAGLPDLRELANILAEELEKKPILAEPRQILENGGDPQEIIELYKNNYTDEELKIKIAHIIESVEEENTSILHKMITELPPCDFITTNYDHLLEKSYTDSSEYQLYYKEDQMHQPPNPSINIYKIHGDTIEPSSIVITKDDFEQWMNQSNNKAFKDKLRVLFREKILVLIGYSAQDINFRIVYKEIHSEHNGKTNYLISDDSELEADDLVQQYGFKFVHSDANHFIQNLQIMYQRFSMSNSSIERKESSFTKDKNPFKYISSEIVRKGEEDIIKKYFIPPTDYIRMVEPGSNTIIEGHRGSGKSWLLRYLSIILNQSDENLAFYIKCLPEAFYATEKEFEDDIKWARFFQHYFNLFLMTHICELMEDELSFDNSNEIAHSIGKIFHLENVNSLDSLCDLLYSEMDLCTTGQYDHLTLTGPLVLLHSLKKLHNILQFQNVYILLDEFDNLSTDQQRVINTTLRSRNAPLQYNFHLNYKIGVKSGSMCYHDTNNKILRKYHDYYPVSLDRFTIKDREKYISFLKNVANRRLDEEEFNINNIEVLLPSKNYESIEEPLSIGMDYSGFRNYAYLSSGIVRDFVSLVKDTLYYAFPDISQKKVELNPIPCNAQNHVVKIKSVLHYMQSNEDIENPEHVRRLIDALGELFKGIQTAGVNRYKKRMANDDFNYVKEKDLIRRTSQICINTMSSPIEDELEDYLRQALEVQLLQEPLFPRNLHAREKTPYRNYKFHRLLTPYFSLAIQNRHPREINADHFNTILHDTDSFVKSLLENWLEFLVIEKDDFEFDWGDE